MSSLLFTTIVCAWFAFIMMFFNAGKLSAKSGEKLDALLETNSLPTVKLIESKIEELKKSIGDGNARLVIAKMEAKHGQISAISLSWSAGLIRSRRSSRI